MSNSDCQPDITSTLLCFSLWRDLTSEHLPELHPTIHASRGQEPGARAELHSVDLAVMRVLQDRRPASNWGNRHSQEGGQDTNAPDAYPDVKHWSKGRVPGPQSPKILLSLNSYSFFSIYLNTVQYS